MPKAAKVANRLAHAVAYVHRDAVKALAHCSGPEEGDGKPGALDHIEQCGIASLLDDEAIDFIQEALESGDLVGVSLIEIREKHMPARANRFLLDPGEDIKIEGFGRYRLAKTARLADDIAERTLRTALANSATRRA